MINKFNIILMCMLMNCLTACGQVTTKVTIVDEKGIPIEGAQLELRFEARQSDDDVVKKSLTDKKGVVSITGSTELSMKGYVTKEGYYRSITGHLDKSSNHDFKIVLRKKISPIPLYAKKVTLGMPEKNIWIGYDFEMGDFVAPYGKGKKKDIELRSNSLPVESNGQVVRTKELGKLEVKFTNKHEGIVYVKDKSMIASDMKLPHQAPKTGYNNRLLIDRAKNYIEDNRKGAFLRVRLKMDGEKMKFANYVKIQSDLHFDPRETGWHFTHKGKPKQYGRIKFTYYFNPTPNDRNLEFDPTQNLFKNLDSTEKVRQP